MEPAEENDIFEEEGVNISEAAKKSDEKSPDVESIQGTFLSQFKITVSDPEKRTKPSGIKMRETFVVYLIETTPKNAESSLIEEVTSLWRRYSEFELLRNYLVVIYPAVIVPPLPEKRANFIWNKITATDTFDNDFLERRRAGLESFLHRIAGHRKLGKDKIVKHFITKEESWREELMATGFQAKADSWLKKVNASLRVREPNLRYEQLKCYANNLQTNATALLKVRAKLAERVYGIYKIHSNYSRVFKEWALVEDSPLKEALQKSSIDVDAYGISIDNLIDEEDQIAEQLKEYLYFADSLKTICKKHEALQYDVEWYESSLTNALTEKKQLLSGPPKTFSFSGLKARLLGADAADVTETRLEVLETNITDLEKELEKHRVIAKEFLDEADEEVELFKTRKVMDLREIFVSYAVLQIKMNKEGAAYWKKIKTPFAAILENQA
ncbi:sorting nexin-4-like [Ciona intestinalis]